MTGLDTVRAHDGGHPSTFGALRTMASRVAGARNGVEPLQRRFNKPLRHARVLPKYPGVSCQSPLHLDKLVVDCCRHTPGGSTGAVPRLNGHKSASLASLCTRSSCGRNPVARRHPRCGHKPSPESQPVTAVRLRSRSGPHQAVDTRRLQSTGPTRTRDGIAKYVPMQAYSWASVRKRIPSRWRTEEAGPARSTAARRRPPAVSDDRLPRLLRLTKLAYSMPVGQYGVTNKPWRAVGFAPGRSSIRGGRRWEEAGLSLSGRR